MGYPSIAVGEEVMSNTPCLFNMQYASFEVEDRSQRNHKAGTRYIVGLRGTSVNYPELFTAIALSQIGYRKSISFRSLYRKQRVNQCIVDSKKINVKLIHHNYSSVFNP